MEIEDYLKHTLDVSEYSSIMFLVDLLVEEECMMNFPEFQYALLLLNNMFRTLLDACASSLSEGHICGVVERNNVPDVVFEFMHTSTQHM